MINDSLEVGSIQMLYVENIYNIVEKPIPKTHPIYIQDVENPSLYILIESESEKINQSVLDFLSKVTAAVNIEIQKCKIINLKSIDFDLKSFTFQSNIPILGFLLSTNQNTLAFNDQKIYPFKDSVFIASNPIHQVMDKTEMKKILWNNLKTHFQL